MQTFLGISKTPYSQVDLGELLLGTQPHPLDAPPSPPSSWSCGFCLTLPVVSPGSDSKPISKKFQLRGEHLSCRESEQRAVSCYLNKKLRGHKQLVFLFCPSRWDYGSAGLGIQITVWWAQQKKQSFPRLLVLGTLQLKGTKQTVHLISVEKALFIWKDLSLNICTIKQFPGASYPSITCNSEYPNKAPSVSYLGHISLLGEASQRPEPPLAFHNDWIHP